MGAAANSIEEFYWALDGSWSTMGVFCDHSKAFDCVNHNILLPKLSTFNLSKGTVSWIESYLDNRKQKTTISKKTLHLNLTGVQDGVPQGSIFGPLLFLLYVKNLPSIISHNLKLYAVANDTTAVIIRPVRWLAGRNTSPRSDKHFCMVLQFGGLAHRCSELLAT